MKPAERDALLARLDERSHNTWRVVEDIKSGQDKQNGAIAQNTQDIAILKDRGGLGWKAKAGGGLAGIGLLAWNLVMWLRQQPPL